MPDPTLADFADALDRIKERWPDAPGLPRDYGFDETLDGVTVMFCNQDRVPDAAALAMLVGIERSIG